MDILLDDQEVQVQEAAAAFLAGECSPQRVRDAEASDARYLPELWSKLAENGWLQLCLSDEAGGEALPLPYLALLFELAGYHIAPIPLHATMVAAMTVDRHGTPAQRKILAGVTSGALILTHAVMEKQGRWSADAIALEGREDGDTLVLNGAKHFVANYGAADQCLVAYRGAQGEPGLALVATDAAGLSSEALVPMAKDGEAIVRFDNVRVPLAARIGAPGEGRAIVEDMMDLSAVLHASMLAGAARKMLDMAVAHAKERVAFGQPIGAFQAIQHMAANMLNAVDGTTMLAREALWRMQQGLPCRTHIAQAKAFANEHCMMVARSAQQIHGGMGFMLEFDLNLWYRRVGSWSMRSGTAAEHRRTIAAALLDRKGKVRIGDIPVN